MSFFGKNVKKIRTVKRMSQQAFADLFDLKRATLGAYEEGRSEPKIDTIIKVANYFSISIDDMLTKEITVNQLLSFNGGVTTDINQILKNTLIKVPLVTSMNKELFIQDFPKTKSYQDMPTITLPIKQDQGLLAFVIEDLTMVANQEGVFLDDIVIGKNVEVSKVNKGEVVIVLSDDILFVRRFSKTDTHYVFKADHINVAAIEISLDKNIDVWRVDHVILKRYPKFTSGIEHKINQIINKLSEN